MHRLNLEALGISPPILQIPICRSLLPFRWLSERCSRAGGQKPSSLLDS